MTYQRLHERDAAAVEKDLVTGAKVRNSSISLDVALLETVFTQRPNVHMESSHVPTVNLWVSAHPAS